MALGLIPEMNERSGNLFVVKKGEFIFSYFDFPAGTRVIADGIIIAHTILVQDLVDHLAAAAAKVFVVCMKRLLIAVFAAMVAPGFGRRGCEFTHIYSADWGLLLIEGYNRLCSI